MARKVSLTMALLMSLKGGIPDMDDHLNIKIDQALFLSISLKATAVL